MALTTNKPLKTPQNASDEEKDAEMTKTPQTDEKPQNEASVASDEALEGEQNSQKLFVDTVELTIVENGYVIYARSKYDQLSKMYVVKNFFEAQNKIKEVMGVIDDFKEGKEGRQKPENDV